MSRQVTLYCDCLSPYVYLARRGLRGSGRDLVDRDRFARCAESAPGDVRTRSHGS